jgi:hypothetical protein
MPGRRRMKRANAQTIFHLCEVLQWAKGLRGSKNCNPYGVPEVEAALRHLADLQGIKDWLDAKTAHAGPI